MRRFRIVIVVLFIASAAALAASSVIGGLAADRTQPSIQCPEEPLYLSVYEKGEKALLAGVTAWDDKDGDLTGQVIVQDIGKSIQGSRTTVTYAVVDGDNHVATQSRPVEYTDYTAPQFSITQPLRYTAGERIRIRDRLHAQDVIDGDLSNRIKIMASGLIDTIPGTYPITLEVTNSLGDTASVTVDVMIQSQEEARGPQIQLTEYLVYIRQGAGFDPMAYVDTVSGGSEGSVRAQMPEGGLVPGENTVVYTCSGSNGTTGAVSLCVVVE